MCPALNVFPCKPRLQQAAGVQFIKRKSTLHRVGASAGEELTSPEVLGLGEAL